MDEDRLEHRLRTDPAGDDGHETGQFLERLAGSATRRTRSTVQTRNSRPLGAAVVGLAALMVVLLVRLGGFVPGPSSSPTALPTAAPINPAALQKAVERWAAASGVATGTVTVIGPTGDPTTVSVAGDPRPGRPTIGRIGEVARMFVVSAALVLIDCARISQAGCPLSVPAGAMRLDDHVSRWLPNSPAGDRTIRQLLDGTSGLAPLGPTIADLNDRIAADPGADWSRSALLVRVLAAPQRFAPGTRRDPVDTEIALLEELIEQAAHVPASRWIDAATIGHLRLGDTGIGAVEPGRLTPGRTTAGNTLVDLPPALIGALGASGGMVSDSPDLAQFAAADWGTALINDVATVQLSTDAANGHRAPMGASGYCPCIAGEYTLVGQTGHAIGWSALAAYDFRDEMAIAAVLATDVSEAQLDALLQAVVDAAHT